LVVSAVRASRKTAAHCRSAALSRLVNLRELRADYNGVTSIAGIERLQHLKTLSLRGNKLQALNLLDTAWRSLEHLNVSHNELLAVRGLGTLRRLKSLNVEHNLLSRLELGPSMPRLRALRLSYNAAVEHLDVQPAPQLRTLHADYCGLERVEGIETLIKLHNLSLRQQVSGNGLLQPAQHVPHAARLFLSGNALPRGLCERTAPFTSLVYLELSGCQLSSLPAELGSLAPNLRHLNADYNLFARIPPLQGLARLKRLSLVGCRLKRSRAIVDALHHMPELAVLDVRTNPCTLGLYPPLMLVDKAAPADAPASQPAFLPPMPNPNVVQPDTAAAEARQARLKQKAAQADLEKSFFHKRPHDIGAAALLDADEDDGEPRADDAQTQALYAASDARFARTLPPHFASRRLLHRGTLAMACPALEWLDGVAIDEDEVLQADEMLSRLGSVA
jgi:hypothetical protein